MIGSSPATPEQKAVLKTMSPDQITATNWRAKRLAQDLLAPGNGTHRRNQGDSPTTAGSRRGRPARKNVYKIYAESFRSEAHLRQIQREAQDTIASAIAGAKALFDA